ncbi:hypothetical protein BH11PLA1_BH11PLA1_07500 [soil metagenome]
MTTDPAVVPPTTAPAAPAAPFIPCARCGYNLAGLPDTAVCSECGAPVLITLHVRQRHAPLITCAPRFRTALLCHGAAGVAALLAAALAMGVMSVFGGDGVVLPIAGAIIALVGSILLSFESFSSAPTPLRPLAGRMLFFSSIALAGVACIGVPLAFFVQELGLLAALNLLVVLAAGVQLIALGFTHIDLGAACAAFRGGSAARAFGVVTIAWHGVIMLPVVLIISIGLGALSAGNRTVENGPIGALVFVWMYSLPLHALWVLIATIQSFRLANRISRITRTTSI